MQKNKEALVSVLSVLDKQGVLPHIILVGSWAEFLYGEASVLEEFASLGRTTDMDFLIKNLRQPKKKASIVEAMKKAGYAYNEDSITGCSKFYKDDLEIEFLICQRGNGVNPLPRTNLGVNAQEMTHMNVTAEHTIKVCYEGFDVCIPTPEAYVIQKMIINDRRGLKKGSDQEKISSILPHISIDELNNVFEGLTRNEKHNVEKFINEHVPEYSIKEGVINQG